MIGTLFTYLLAGGLASYAQSAISAPTVGAFRDTTGSLERVIGLAGNFVLADAGIGNILSAAFSSSAGLVKTDTELLVLDARFQITSRFEVSGGPALLAFDANGDPALAFISGRLFQIAGTRLTPVDWTGAALAIGFASPGSAFVIVHAGRTLVQQQVALPVGTVASQTSLAEIHPPVLLLPDGGILFTSGQCIVLRGRDGAEHSIDGKFLVDTFESLSTDWIAVREKGSSRVFALRVGPLGLDLFQLPEENP